MSKEERDRLRAMLEVPQGDDDDDDGDIPGAKAM